MNKVALQFAAILVAQLFFGAQVRAQCPVGYEESSLADYPEYLACTCPFDDTTCVDDIEGPNGYVLCSEAPVCEEVEEDPIPACGAFSFGALFDYLWQQDEDYRAPLKRLAPLFNERKDLWLARAIEDSDSREELMVIYEALTADPEAEDFEEEDPDFEDEEPIDDDEPFVGTICYSIEDLLNSLNEQRCTSREKRMFQTAQPLLRKVLANSGLFVGNGIEEVETARTLRTLLTRVTRRCMPKKRK